MKSRTLAGVAAVGVLAIVVAVTLFFRTIGCTGLAITKPAARRGKPTTARSSNGQERFGFGQKLSQFTPVRSRPSGSAG